MSSDDSSAQSNLPVSPRPRPNRNLILFAAGASFFALSSLITRRSLARRYKAIMPPFYTTSSHHQPQVNGAMEAFEALNIATINVASIAMVVAGGSLWAFDINSMEDMRRKIRGGLGVDGSGRSEKDAEEEFEEWIASVLARKEDKEKRRKEDAVDSVKNERGKPR